MMSFAPLTKKEAELLNWLREYYTKNGYMPTLSEMSGAFGLKYRQSIQNRLLWLEKKKWIKRIKSSPRAIIIMKSL